MTERYANGQPVGYSNRNLCETCAGDLGDCNCPPNVPPADAAREEWRVVNCMICLREECDCDPEHDEPLTSEADEPHERA